MEPVGLAIGVIGIAGLFKSCIDNFDIVVKAREFGTDFDLLCTQLSLQRIRLVLWGETLGITSEFSTSFNPLLNRQDIAPAIESALCHLQLLLQKADIVTGRYEIQGENAHDQAVVDLRSRQSAGLNIFKERFDLLKARLRRNQKEKSTWTVTRWAVHDLGKFKDLVTNIRELMDGLEGITSTLGVLQQQQALLAKEIASISDTQSLRLLQQAGSTDGASVSLRLVSETASVRLSLLDDSPSAGVIRSTKTSYHTALSHFGETCIQRSVIVEDLEPEYPPAMETNSVKVVSELANTNDRIPDTSGQQQPVRRSRRLFKRVRQRVEGLHILSSLNRMQTIPLNSAKTSEALIRPADSSKEPPHVTIPPMNISKTPVAVTDSKEPTEPTAVSGESSTPATKPIMLERSQTTPAYPATEDLEGLPQNQRLMAELVKESRAPLPDPSFTSGSVGYGDALAPIRKRNEETHSDHSLRLLLHANNDKDTSAARRAFLELRSLRTAAVPFVTASLMENRLDRLIASIEGPPDTPYQGGVFWILVKLPPEPTEPPNLRFVTKIYHPNIDCNGNICADYHSWWRDPSLQRYMNGFSAYRRDDALWFSHDKWNSYSLGALLTALCSLLASPNILDPLVPEIAATYVQDYARYCENARLYTRRYALQERPADVDLETFDEETNPLQDVPHQPNSCDDEKTAVVASSAITTRVSSIKSEEGSLNDGERNTEWLPRDFETKMPDIEFERCVRQKVPHRAKKRNWTVLDEQQAVELEQNEFEDGVVHLGSEVSDTAGEWNSTGLGESETVEETSRYFEKAIREAIRNRNPVKSNSEPRISYTYQHIEIARVLRDEIEQRMMERKTEVVQERQKRVMADDVAELASEGMSRKAFVSIWHDEEYRQLRLRQIEVDNLLLELWRIVRAEETEDVYY